MPISRKAITTTALSALLTILSPSSDTINDLLKNRSVNAQHIITGNANAATRQSKLDKIVVDNRIYSLKEDNGKFLVFDRHGRFIETEEIAQKAIFSKLVYENEIKSIEELPWKPLYEAYFKAGDLIQHTKDFFSFIIFESYNLSKSFVEGAKIAGPKGALLSTLVELSKAEIIDLGKKLIKHPEKTSKRLAIDYYKKGRKAWEENLSLVERLESGGLLSYGNADRFLYNNFIANTFMPASNQLTNDIVKEKYSSTDTNTSQAVFDLLARMLPSLEKKEIVTEVFRAVNQDLSSYEPYKRFVKTVSSGLESYIRRKIELDQKALSLISQNFEELKGADLSKAKNTLDWTMHEGPFNSGYVNTQVILPFEKDWKREFESILSLPVISGNTLYIGETFSNFFALSTRDGSIKWETPMRYRHGSNRSSPAVLDDNVFVTGNLIGTRKGTISGDRSYLYKLRTRDGKLRSKSPKMRGLGIPVLYRNHVYYIARGTELKRINTDNRAYRNLFVGSGLIYDPPVIRDNKIHLISKNLKNIEAYVLDTKGNVLWKGDVTPTMAEDDIIYPYVYKGINVIAENLFIWNYCLGDKSFYKTLKTTRNCGIAALDLNTKEKVFEEILDEDHISSIVTDGKQLYVSHGKKISRFLVENNSLKELSTIALQSDISDLLLTNNVIFVGAQDDIQAISRENPSERHILQKTDTWYETRKHLAYSNDALYVVAHTDVYKFSSTQLRKSSELDLSTPEASISTFFDAMKKCDLYTALKTQYDYSSVPDERLKLEIKSGLLIFITNYVGMQTR